MGGSLELVVDQHFLLMQWPQGRVGNEGCGAKEVFDGFYRTILTVQIVTARRFFCNENRGVEMKFIKGGRQ